MPEVLARSAGRAACGSDRRRTRRTSGRAGLHLGRDGAQRVQRVVGLVLAEDRAGRGRRGRSRTCARRPPRSSGRPAACRRSPRTSGRSRSCHRLHRVVQASLEHRRRPAVVLRGPEHDDRVDRALLVAVALLPDPDRRRRPTTATARPETMIRRTRSPARERVRPRGTSCTSGPIRTSMARCGRSAHPTA